MKKHVSILLGILFASASIAQEISLGNQDYEVKVEKMVKATPVKDQENTGTCWSFSTASFLESEALRMNKGEYDLSEMYFVRHAYEAKADRYVRMQGKTNFGPGGLSHDVITVAREYGMVPENVYTGKASAQEPHDHAELQIVLEGMLSPLVEKASKPLSDHWKPALEGVLDAYLGQEPESFVYQNTAYTPQRFAEEAIGFNPDNYVEITSFTHHPYYQPMVLEIPDNWSAGLYYNVPLDELLEIMDYALEQGYSMTWDGDVSEEEFSHKNGMALVPEKAWHEKTAEEKRQTFQKYEPEKEITQEMRQEMFDNYQTTDDHLMHILGVVSDKHGNKYYLTKNSWGTESNGLGGYLYMSEAYVRLKSVSIMLHKDAIPAPIAQKLKL